MKCVVNGQSIKRAIAPSTDKKKKNKFTKKFHKTLSARGVSLVF